MIIYDLLDTNEDILPGSACGQNSVLIILAVVVGACYSIEDWQFTCQISQKYNSCLPPCAFSGENQKKREVKARGLPCSLPTSNMIAGQVKDLSDNPRPQAKAPHPPVYLFFCCHCPPVLLSSRARGRTFKSGPSYDTTRSFTLETSCLVYKC